MIHIYLYLSRKNVWNEVSVLSYGNTFAFRTNGPIHQYTF